jgi:MtfA peptidase
MSAYLLVVAVAAAIIGAIVGGPLIRRWRRQGLRKAPLPAPWLPLLDIYVRGHRGMPQALRRRWHDAIKVFVAEKRYIGCDGLVVTEEMRVAIAAQACLMVCNRPGGGFEALRWILVYPTAFHVRRQEVDAAGVETSERALLSGESWDSGRVVIAWDEVWCAAHEGWEGESVVVHEFAHQLDEESGATAELWASDGDDSDAWARVLGEEYASLQARTAHGDAGLLDDYGASDPAEFFAVATEAFFVAPGALLAEHPRLYGQLRSYYNVDPASWREAHV